MKVAPLGRLAEINVEALSEKTPGEQEISYVDLASADLQASQVRPRRIHFEDAPSRARRLATRGDTLIPYLVNAVSWMEMRPILISDELAQHVYSTGFFCVSPGPRLEHRFLNYVLSSRQVLAHLQAWARGVTMIAFSEDDLGNVSVPFLGLAEQRAVADFLDRETARIDALISAKRRMMNLLEERRVGRIAILLGGGPQGMPEGWRMLPIRRLCPNVTVGVVVNPSSYFQPSGIPFIHGSDVREGWIDESNFKFLSPQDNMALWKSRLRSGDVIAMRVGEPGRSAVVPTHLDGSNCASVLIFRESGELASELLSAFLNSPLGKAQIASFQYGAAQGVMNVEHALQLRVPVPPTTEQTEIVELLRRTESQAHRSRHKLTRQIKLLAERRQSLITAAVTGQMEISSAA